MINRRRAIVGATVAALLGAAGMTGLVGTGAPEASAAATEYAVAGRQDLVLTAEASGTLEPIRTVEVKSKASGEVLKVYVETGDHVEQGQLLAEIDPRDVQSTLDQASAELESARVQLSTAQAQVDRMEELREAHAVTQQEYESAVQAAASARAAVVRVQTDLRLAGERRQDVTIRAPISGTIISRDAEPGQIIASATANVSGGSSLFTMADLSEMQVRALVDETDMGRIQPGQSVEVTVEAYPGRTFRGEVYKVEPQAVVEQNVTTFPALVRLQNPEELLKPGMNAEVSVQIDSRENVTVVPNEAVMTPKEAEKAAAALGLGESAVRGTPASTATTATTGAAGGGDSRQGEDGDTRTGVVFVQGANGTEARSVTLGMSDYENTEVVAGVKAGERVVVASAPAQAESRSAGDRQPAMGMGGLPGMGGGRRGG